MNLRLKPLPVILLLFLLSAVPAAHGNDLSDHDVIKALSSVFRKAAARTRPSVVYIGTYQIVRRRKYHPFFHDDIFNFFFDTPAHSTDRPQRVQRSLGTGFIVKGSYIITNAHVVEGADEIIVRLSDKRELPAKLLGSDKQLDVAVLQVDAKKLPSVEIGDSSKVQVGDWVLAIGNPFGFTQTVTQGIISAKGREDNALQTSASINPGNSGGPLINLEGKVIAVNRAIYSRTGESSGIGFAIPINIANKVLEDIIQHGKVLHGWIGLSTRDHGRKTEVALVSLNSPADKAGLKSGDIVLKADNTLISSSSQLNTIITSKREGESISITVERNEQEFIFKCTVSDRDKWQQKNRKWLELMWGVTTREVTPDISRQLGFRGLKGMYITRIAGRRPAAKAGIKPGDVILAVNSNHRITGTDDYLLSLAKLTGRSVVLTILRGEYFFNVKLDF